LRRKLRIGTIARLAVIAALVLTMVTALMPVGSSGGSEAARNTTCLERPGDGSKALVERCRPLRAPR
jgi:hypothetical protein